MLTLDLLGGACLTRDGTAVSGAVTQRRRLALLALLAVPGGRALSRDKLIAYFWPESSSEQARHLLSEALYVVRKAAGEGAIITAGDEVQLSADIVATDVTAFERALAREELEEALALYRGPFLDGFFIADAPEFERWAERERARLATAHRQALEAFTLKRESDGDAPGAVAGWRQLVQLDPYSARFTLRLMQALAAIGDRAAALQHARVHAALLRAEFDAQPDPEIEAYSEKLRDQPVMVASSATVQAPATPHVIAASPPADYAMSDAIEAPSRVPAAARENAGPKATVTPESGETSAAKPRHRRPPRRLRRAAVPLAVGVLAALWVIATSSRDVSPPAAALGADNASIAVLPFVDLSQTRDQEWLGDGFAEQLIRELVRLPGVRVASRTSSFSFRTSGVGVSEIGRQLGAKHLVEGSVRLAGERLRVTAQLVSVETGYQLWSSEPYDVRVSDVHDVQDEIVRAIAGALGRQLAPPAPAAALARRTDSAAYTRYLQGRYFWNKRSPEGLARAIALFEQAIEQDPDYAFAHAGLADSYALMVTLGALAPAEGYSRARAAAERALARDPDLAEAHASLALVRLYLDHDWPGADRDFRRALELSPGFETGRHWFALYLAYRGDGDAAMREIRLAQQLDPLSVGIQTGVGTLLYYARQYDAAVEQFQQVLAMDPTFLVARLWLGATHLQQRRLAEAEIEAREAERLAPGHPLPIALLGYVFAASGRDEEARRMLADVERITAQRYVSPAYVAALHAALGEHDAAFAALERAYQLRDDWVVYLRVEPVFDPLRGDPRFAQLLARVGP